VTLDSTFLFKTASSSSQAAAPVYLTEEELRNTTPNRRVIVLLLNHKRNKFRYSFQIFCDNDDHNLTKAAIPVTVYNEAWHQVHPKKGKPATLGIALSGIHKFDYMPFPGEGQV
jgi:DNA polymerase IIIc chi subunit